MQYRGVLLQSVDAIHAEKVSQIASTGQNAFNGLVRTVDMPYRLQEIKKFLTMSFTPEQIPRAALTILEDLHTKETNLLHSAVSGSTKAYLMRSLLEVGHWQKSKMAVNKIGINMFFTLIKDSKGILDPQSYKARIDDIISMESDYITDLELWTGLTSHEVIDSVDSLEVNMEGQLKKLLLQVHEKELGQLLEFLKSRVDAEHALVSIFDEYQRERNSLVQKLCYQVDNEQTDHKEIQLEQQIRRSRDIEDEEDTAEERLLAVKQSLKARNQDLTSIMGCKIQTDQVIVQSQEKLEMCMTKAARLKKMVYQAGFSQPIGQTASIVAQNMKIGERVGDDNAFDKMLTDSHSLFYNVQHLAR